MQVACHHCGSVLYRKHGKSRGTQRYLCKSCGRTFLSSGPRFSRSVKEQAIQMYRNNVGIRKIALFLGASPPSVLDWIRKAGADLSERLSDLAASVKKDVPDVIEMDEIYTFIKKNGNE